MALTIEATYENGVLKPKAPLPLGDRETVRITIERIESPLLRAYGILGFRGTVEEADYFALDPELDYPPPPEEP